MIIHNGAVDDVMITAENANSTAVSIVVIAGNGTVDDCMGTILKNNTATAGYCKAVNP